jgi:hypothetical protein
MAHPHPSRRTLVALPDDDDPLAVARIDGFGRNQIRYLVPVLDHVAGLKGWKGIAGLCP